MKRLNFLTIIIVVIILISCNYSDNPKYLSGYWEIVSVHLNEKELKNFPFSSTIDYFILMDDDNGFRKKVKPRFDGNFDVTFHQIKFKIERNKNDIYLVYGEGENFIESITKIDSLNLHLKNSEGYKYKYKRFYPKNYLDE